MFPRFYKIFMAKAQNFNPKLSTPGWIDILFNVAHLLLIIAVFYKNFLGIIRGQTAAKTLKCMEKFVFLKILRHTGIILRHTVVSQRIVWETLRYLNLQLVVASNRPLHTRPLSFSYQIFKFSNVFHKQQTEKSAASSKLPPS